MLCCVGGSPATAMAPAKAGALTQPTWLVPLLRNADTDANTSNYTNADAYSHANGNSHSYSDSYSDGYSNSYRHPSNNTEASPDRCASPDAAAVGVSGIVIRGQRPVLAGIGDGGLRN